MYSAMIPAVFFILHLKKYSLIPRILPLKCLKYKGAGGIIRAMMVVDHEKVNKYERGQLIMGFIDVIKEKARADKKTIVLPESEDRRVLEATATILKEGLANVVLIGITKNRSKKMQLIWISQELSL